MTRILTHWATKIVLLVIGYLAAVAFMRASSVTYNYCLTNRGDTTPVPPPAFSMIMFLACVALLCLCVERTKPKRPPFWRKADFFMAVVIAAMLEQWCLAGVDSAISSYSSGGLHLFSSISYLVAVFLLLETVARVRDRSLTQTLYWLRFYRLHTLREPIAVVTFTAGAANLLGFVFTYPRWEYGVVVTGFFALMLVALTYFCAYDLSASERHAQANADKIQAERFKAELITNISHDIRTPLTSIINYVDLLHQLPIDQSDYREYVTVLDQKSARLKTLLDDLMDASKLTTGAVELTLRELDLAEIVGQIAGESDDLFTDRGLTLVLRQPDGPVPVTADSRHLWRVLENLFGNAAKYSLPGTRVFAEIVHAGASVVFSLKNTSQNPIDLPADALTEQFIRGDRARHTDGNGLGLFIAKSLTEAMGGAFAINVSGDLFEASIEFAQTRIPAETALARH